MSLKVSNRSMREAQLTYNGRQHGFTLVEVLVALIVLAIGLLGLANLQVVGLRNTHGAYLESQATLLAYDMMDRIRSNQVWSDIDGDNRSEYIFNYRAFKRQTILSLSPDAKCISQNGCTPEQMTQNDVFEWNAAVVSTLPDGRAEVCTDDRPDANLKDTSASCVFNTCTGNGDRYFIRIQWQDDQSTRCLLKTFIPAL